MCGRPFSYAHTASLVCSGLRRRITVTLNTFRAKLANTACPATVHTIFVVFSARMRFFLFSNLPIKVMGRSYIAYDFIIA